MPPRKVAAAKAYHHVDGYIMDEVMAAGKIEVGAARLDPQIWNSDCPDRIRDLIANAESRGSGAAEANDVAVQALSDLAAERVEEIHLWQRKRGFDATSTKTDFQCLDFLAGDLSFVFLSVDDWISWGRDEPSGFVFDAEKLLREGALLRVMDLGPRYAIAVSELLMMPWHDYRAAKRGIMDTIAEVQKRGQLAGKSAIRFLRETAEERSVAVLARPIEILWPGDLPVSLAESAWKEGIQVSGGA